MIARVLASRAPAAKDNGRWFGSARRLSSALVALAALWSPAGARVEAQEAGPEVQRSLPTLAACQAAAEGARREPDARKRLERFDAAASGYQALLDAHAGTALPTEAARSYLALLADYGRALELALEDAEGDEALALRATIRRALGAGLARTADLELDRGPTEKLGRWRAMLERAGLRILLGRASDEPEAELAPAGEGLERVLAEAGATSGPGLQARLGLAKLARARGDFERAAAIAQSVLSAALPADPGAPEWRDLDRKARLARFRLAELAVPDLLASHAARGEAAAACRSALHFHDAWRREGFELSPFGHLALLAVATTLLEADGLVAGPDSAGTRRWFAGEAELRAAGLAGEFDSAEAESAAALALRCAQEVRRANAGNTLERRALRCIAAHLGRPGTSVAPEVLLDLGRSEYGARDYAAASAHLEALIHALEQADEATRRANLPQALLTLGRSQAELARPLEAALSFREAVTASDDAALQQEAARGFQACIRAAERASPGDPRIAELCLQAEDALAQAGDDDALWRRAERRYGREEYDAARSDYLAVGRDADEHEKARVQAALCLYRRGDREGARRELADYLRTFVPAPEHAVTGARKLAARAEASAQATFTLGRMASEAGDHDQVLAWLAGYERAFPAQVDYAAGALLLVLGAQLARQDLAAAEATLAVLQTRFPASPQTGKAALELVPALQKACDAAAQAGDRTRVAALRREMAEALRSLNRTGPAFGNLRLESSLWLELDEWVAAEESLRATLAAFRDDPARASDLAAFVLPDLGRALLGQRRASDAFAVLDALVPEDPSGARKPARSVVHDWCRSVTGWLEDGAAGEPVEVPGVGGEANLARACERLGQLIGLEEASREAGHGAWTCPWYELQLELLHARLAWSRVDPAQKAQAEQRLEDLRRQLGDPDLQSIATSCGDERLRRRYLWIGSRLR